MAQIFSFKRVPHTIDCALHGLPNQADVTSILATTGHVRFRNLDLPNGQQMELKYGHLVGTPMRYKGGSEYRNNIGSAQNVLDVGYIPHHLLVAQHNEMAYTDQWPQLFALGCIKNTFPPEQGITPICDNKKVLEHMPTELFDKYMDLGVRYLRMQIDIHNCDHIAADKLKEYTPWQKSFLTENKEDVERECELKGYRYQWNNDGSLSYEYDRPSFVGHPKDGVLCLFNTLNGVDWYDTASLHPTKRPYWNQWGDGTEFSNHEQEVMRDLYAEFTMGDTWESGDMLLLDNHYTTHGRTPFNPQDGTRVIGVLMGNEVRRTTFEAKGVGQCEFV